MLGLKLKDGQDFLSKVQCVGQSQKCLLIFVVMVAVRSIEKCFRNPNSKVKVVNVYI